MSAPKLDAKLEEIAERYCTDAQRGLPQAIHAREKWSPCQCDRVLATLREAVEAAVAQRDSEWIRALFPGSEGTTTGEFAMNPERAGLLKREEIALAESEAVAQERAAMRVAAEEHYDETVDWLLRMQRTADPGSEAPKNFEPDLRTKAAIASWLMDNRKPLLLAWLDARGAER